MGRTGVFITLSIALERMRYEGVVDMFQTVKTLRTQRPAMVQTEVSRPVCGTQVSSPNSPPAVSCTCSWPTCVCSCYSHVALLVLPNLRGREERAVFIRYLCPELWCHAAFFWVGVEHSGLCKTLKSGHKQMRLE